MYARGLVDLRSRLFENRRRLRALWILITSRSPSVLRERADATQRGDVGTRKETSEAAAIMDSAKTKSSWPIIYPNPWNDQKEAG